MFFGAQNLAGVVWPLFDGTIWPCVELNPSLSTLGLILAEY